MKSILVTIVSLIFLLQTVVGFTVIVPSASTSIRPIVGTTPQPYTVALRSSPAENNEDEEGLDLNLEEMFTMFDAADKGVDFDKAIDKVKSEK